MKKLAGLIIILAVLVLGGYYGMGVMTERAIKNNVEVINQSNGLFADIEEYNRGWFTSDAQLKWRLHVPEHIVKDANGASQTVAAQDYNLVTSIKIYHGPFIYAHNMPRFGMGYAETVIPFPEQYNQQFDEMFSKDSQKPALDLSIFVNYMNNSTMELALPQFKLISKDGTGDFDWMGLTSSTTTSANMDKVDGDVQFDGMTFSKGDTKAVLGKITTDYNLHKTDSGLFLGDASFSLSSFNIVEKGQKLFDVTDFSLSSSSDIQDALFSAHFNVELKSLTANGQNYGPGELEIALRNLDAEILAKINEQANAMQNGTEAERQQAMMALFPEVPKLFSKGAELEVSQFNFKLPQGMIDGTLLVTLPKGDNANPFELVQKIQGHAKLKVSAAVLKAYMQQISAQLKPNQQEAQQAVTDQSQAGQPAPAQDQSASDDADKQISAMQQSGLITADGSDYVIEVNLDQGKFSINGKPFDPAMLKF